MLDYESIRAQLNNLSDQYNRDVACFCDYSPLGHYTGANSNVHQYVTICTNITPVVSTQVSTEQSLKKLLKTIHPDKIVLMFGTEMPTVSACASVIIQENMDFTSAVKFLNKELPENVVDDIFRKSNIDKPVFAEECDTCIDRHLDAEFVQLCRQYEEIRHCTLYGFVKQKLSNLFTTLTMDLNNLLTSIAMTLFAATRSYPTNAEELAMYREEHWLEFSLEDTTINLSRLAECFPSSSFSKTYTFVRDHVANIDASVTISQRTNYNALNTTKLLTYATKRVYESFTQSRATK